MAGVLFYFMAGEISRALETVRAIKGVPLDEKYYSDNVAIVPITEYTTV